MTILQRCALGAALAALGAVLPARSAAQRCAPRDPAVRAVLQLEDAWASAVVRRDSATFERLLDPEFVYTENDRLESRTDVLHDVIHGADTVTAAHNEDMVVHCFGTTAVVTGWLVTEGRGGGRGFVRRYRFTDTWMRRNGRWRIVAAEDYLAAPSS